MQDLLTAAFAFKHKQGRNGHPADTLLLKLASHVSQPFQKALSISSLKTRISYLEDHAREFFFKNNIKDMNVQPLDNGGETLVFDCNNDYILKVKPGQPFEKTNAKKHVLQPEHGVYSKELDLSCYILPKVEVVQPTAWQAYKMRVKCLLQGDRLHDDGPCNFGYVASKNKKKKMVVIDQGAVSRIDSLKQAISCAKDLCMPLYHHIPLIKPCWRAFKKSVGMKLN